MCMLCTRAHVCIGVLVSGLDQSKYLPAYLPAEALKAFYFTRMCFLPMEITSSTQMVTPKLSGLLNWIIIIILVVHLLDTCVIVLFKVK